MEQLTLITVYTVTKFELSWHLCERMILQTDLQLIEISESNKMPSVCMAQELSRSPT